MIRFKILIIITTKTNTTKTNTTKRILIVRKMTQMHNVYIFQQIYYYPTQEPENMETTKASFQIEIPLWRKFLEIAKFKKNSSASALLRGFIKDTVGENS